MLGHHSPRPLVWSPSEVSANNQPLPSPVARVVLECWDAHDWHRSSDALTDWLNSRWTKTDFKVSYEVVCFTLRISGRNAVMGLGDSLAGAFYREI